MGWISLRAVFTLAGHPVAAFEATMDLGAALARGGPARLTGQTLNRLHHPEPGRAANRA